MGRRSRTRELFVAMNGEMVATLTQHSTTGLTLRYSADWLARHNAIPISLSLPLSSEPYVGPSVASYFDNLLPDNHTIRERMQRTLNTETATPFDLLSAAGADCVGALQLSPGPEMKAVRGITATPLSEAEVAHMLRSYRQLPLGMSEDDDFRISIAGAQEKTALLWQDDRWCRPHGTTPTTHILKLPMGRVDERVDLTTSVYNEWLCLALARQLGLPVAKAEIQRFEDVSVLVVERFDRRWSQDGSWIIRLPQEDFCQALGVAPAYKYEADGGPGIRASHDLLMKSMQPLEDRETFFRAQIIYFLLAAIDGHAKNFSIHLHAQGRFRLCPMYDVLSAYPTVSPKFPLQKLKLAMALHGKHRHYRLHEIRRQHFSDTAKHCGFPVTTMEDLLQDVVNRVEPAIETIAKSLKDDFPAAVADPIFAGLRGAARKLAAEGSAAPTTR